MEPRAPGSAAGPSTFGSVSAEQPASPEPSGKRMRLRYAGTCRLCGRPLSSGADAVYERDSRTVRCIECSDDGQADADTAGASARREYERRSHDREQRIRTNHPKLGGLILALSDDPQSTKAWERGALGEEQMACRMNELPDSFRVLHDRRIRGSRANVDHIAVGPGGVWVIDAKRYVGKRPALRVEGGFFGPRTETLRIGGRDGTKLVRGVQGQVERVSSVLNDATVPITGVLCFLEAEWPLIGGSFVVDGIHVTWPRLLIRRMAEAEQRPHDVEAIHARLAAAFPRA